MSENTSNNISCSCFELFDENTQKELNNDERTFTGTLISLICNNSKGINSSGK